MFCNLVRSCHVLTLVARPSLIARGDRTFVSRVQDRVVAKVPHATHHKILFFQSVYDLAVVLDPKDNPGN